MKITKLGHCCLLIKTEKLTILTDPGAFSESQNFITGIDLVLITHEHNDHLHVDSLKKVIANNPKVRVMTNSGVAKILDVEKIKYELLEGKNVSKINGLLLEAFDCRHEEVFEEIGQVQNTGYFIDNKLFYPGDAYCKPGKPVEVLALPVAGPWCKIPEAIRYALAVKPKRAFPVHDGMLQRDRIGAAHKVSAKVLAENNIDFVIMNEGEEVEF